jgi:murein DD-endopeptidase MepM/ murein hydrolase activator NlpD
MWHNPIALLLQETDDEESFKTFDFHTTGLPVGDHPGAFGCKRLFHKHEGVDLYCCHGMPVYAVEDGEVVAIEHFTGEKSNPPSPWWNDTHSVLIEGQTGVVVYGEVDPLVSIGDKVKAGQTVARVRKVLKKDKGRPMSMLHLELHEHGTRQTYEWMDEQPASLFDPTPYLLLLAKGD